jgi:hypothetical protein
MQSSPDALLEAIADSLREALAPRIEDPFTRGQIEAAAEILDNLAARVQWRADMFGEPYAQVRALVQEACTRAPDGALPLSRAWLAAADDRTPEVEAAWASALGALAEVQAWLAVPATSEPALDALLAQFLHDDHKREQSLLRTGMFRDRRGDR